MWPAIYSLVQRTLQSPRDVAVELGQIPFSMRTLWGGLALAAVLNTLVFSISMILAPPPMGVPAVFGQPLPFTVLVAAGLAITVFALVHCGRLIGGTASLRHILTLVVWLQLLRSAVQFAAFVLSFIVPPLASIGLFAASLYGLWIMLNFVDVAHGLDSKLSALGVMLMSGLALIFGLAILLSILGIQNMELLQYV